MPDNDNGYGAAVAEITASTELAKDFTLFQIEESLVLLAESAEEEGHIAETVQAVTKLRGTVSRVPAGSLPEDGKLIEDRRKFD